MQPVQPTEQQLRLHWRELQIEELCELPTEEPAEPKPGDRWYDADAHCLCIWDGIAWDPVHLD
jgi:hypothetical protein